VPSRPLRDEGDDHVDREARGDLAGVMPTHPVGDDAEAERFLNRKTVFVGRPDPALVGESVRVKRHP
jgi:hypothetical protein